MIRSVGLLLLFPALRRHPTKRVMTSHHHHLPTTYGYLTDKTGGQCLSRGETVARLGQGVPGNVGTLVGTDQVLYCVLYNIYLRYLGKQQHQ